MSDEEIRSEAPAGVVLTREFRCVPHGEMHPRIVPVGETLTGVAAAAAIALGFADAPVDAPAASGKSAASKPPK